jgi:hypothetical protein
MDHMWQSRDHAQVWCKSATSLLKFLNEGFLQETYLTKDGEASYLAVKIPLPSHGTLFIYIKKLIAIYKEYL